MNDLSIRPDIRHWIADHLDPLTDHAVDGGARRSDFDLSTGRWGDKAGH